MSDFPEQVGARELTQIMVAYSQVLNAHRQAIDSLNVFPVPDGDTGTNMAMTVDSVVKEIEARVGAYIEGGLRSEEGEGKAGAGESKKSGARCPGRQ